MKKKWLSALHYVLVFIYSELVLHLAVYRSLDWRFIYPIFFGAVAGSVLWYLCSLLPQKVNRIMGGVVLSLVTVWYEVQLIYYCIFKGFMPISQLLMGADAVTNFAAQLLHGVVTNWLPILVLLAPLPLTIVLLCKKKLPAWQLKKWEYLIALSLPGALGVLSAVLLIVTNTGSTSAYQILTDPHTSTDLCVKTNGLVATTLQELRGMMNPAGQEVSFQETPLDKVESGLPTNALDLDFEQLSKYAPSKTLKQINDYLAGVSATNQHAYTGLAKGYNLITICAEAFSPLVISEELTPTLYKLSTNGFVFENFYNSFPNTTTNGEYTMCMGLLPNMTRNKIQSSFNDTVGHYLPYTLGNAMKEEGYNAYAYHNYYGSFYDRYLTHKNMGYEFKAIGQGLEIPVGNPTSDLAMIEASLPDLLGSEKPFHAYYMTYSGHYQYDWNNEMSAKNQALVESLPYSEGVKAYIACNLELEHALTALMSALEEAGLADRTVIALTGDHYPYGLTEAQYNELAGETVDPVFEKFRNSFICYVPGMEPVKVADYCSSMDILPTLLNLMGVEYDSRLLAGKDVLSEAPAFAVLADGSFITAEFRYDAATDRAMTADGSSVDPTVVKDACAYVENRFSLSTALLESDYYAHAFGAAAENGTEGVLNFEDITDPYVESTAIFVVSHQLMEPLSKEKFGADRQSVAKELLDGLYRIYYEREGDGMEWGRQVGLIDKKVKADTPLTYEGVATILYEYSRLKYPRSVDISAEEEQYPYLSEKTLLALKWCLEEGHITGSPEALPYVLYDQSFNRYQTALILQRVFLKGP